MPTIHLFRSIDFHIFSSFLVCRSDDDNEDDADGVVANKKVETTDQSKKRKISVKNIEDKPTEESNDEPIHIVNKKAKIEEVSPVRKSTGDLKKKVATSKGFIVEETSENVEKPAKETISNSGAKVQLELTKKKQKISTAKKVSTSVKPVHKKPSAANANTKQKVNVKKANTKSSLVNKGGITKKVAKSQRNNTSSSKKPSISDERLRAFGLNPKKFHKKLKYGNKATASGLSTNSNSNGVTKNKKLDKLSQKKIKKKLLKVLGS